MRPINTPNMISPTISVRGRTGRERWARKKSLKKATGGQLR